MSGNQYGAATCCPGCQGCAAHRVGPLLCRLGSEVTAELIQSGGALLLTLCRGLQQRVRGVQGTANDAEVQGQPGTAKASRQAGRQAVVHEHGTRSCSVAHHDLAPALPLVLNLEPLNCLRLETVGV